MGLTGDRVLPGMPATAQPTSPSSVASSGPRRDASACARKAGESLTTRLEKRFVAAALPYVPRWCETYHLTAATLIWTAGVVAFAVAAHTWSWGALLGIAAMIVLQYLTDLFDGAVGRDRDTGLVRWGFYADHLLDVLFAGSLAIAGAIVVPSLTIWWMVLMLLGLALMVSSFLALAAGEEFAIYHFGMGPTEIRGLLVVGLAAATFVGPAVVPPIVIGMTVVTGVSLVAVAGRTASHLWRLDLAAKADERKKKV